MRALSEATRRSTNLSVMAVAMECTSTASPLRKILQQFNFITASSQVIHMRSTFVDARFLRFPKRNSFSAFRVQLLQSFMTHSLFFIDRVEECGRVWESRALRT